MNALRGFTLASLTLVVCIPLGAQSAQLSGVVKDSSGGVIPEATLTITNQETEINRNAKTNKDGVYVIPFLQPGAYRALIEASGFQTESKLDIRLEVGQQARWDVTLQVGKTEQTLTVSASPTSLNTTDGSVSTVIDRKFVENLPLNGRSFQSLFELTPGTVLVASSQTSQGQFSINGQRSSSNYMMIDGVSANTGLPVGAGPNQAAAGTQIGTSILGGTNTLVSVDGLQEFRIQTSSFAPEFGRTPGGQIQVVTRSGTNSFHGDLFDYFRNDKLDANDWFSNQKGLLRSAERQNDFGGVLGGPIVKNRTFFFVSYEGLRLIQPQTVVGTSVPNLAARNLAPAGLKPYLNAFPLPNGPDFGNGFAEYNASFSNPSNLDAGSIRVDHRIDDRWLVFARYNEAPSSATKRQDSSIQQSPVDQDLVSISNRTITVGTTAILSPRMTLDIRANESWLSSQYASVLGSLGGAMPPSSALLFPISGNPQVDEFLLSLGAANYYAGRGTDDGQRQTNALANLSIVKGHHALKFGTDLRWLSPWVERARDLVAVSFSGIGLPTSPGGPSPSGSVLSGIAAVGSIQASGPKFPLEYTNYSFFAQDAWQVSSRLTLTYGLRWDINPPVTAGGGQKLYTVSGLDSPSTLALAPAGTPMWKTSYTNLAPRVGLAYLVSRRPGSETVIRGGAGLFDDLIGGYIANQTVGPPNAGSRNMVGVAFPFASIALPTIPATLPFSSTFYTSDPNLKSPRIYQWNVAIERALGGANKVSATYVGSLGDRLLRSEDVVAPNSSFSSIYLSRSDAVSNYNALQLQYQGRLARGLQVLASYAWAHSIDTASSDTAGLSALSTYLPANIDRGPSDFDIRHTATSGVTYEFPNVEAGPVGNAILHGWAVDTTVQARSADPVNVYFTRNLGFGSLYSRPDFVQGAQPYIANANAAGGRILNAAAFAVPAQLRPGTLGRNSFRGFGLAQADVSVRRTFALSEQWKLQFRAEFFNITNHPNFGDPFSYLGTVSPTGTVTPANNFGYSPGMLGRSLGGFSPLYQVGGPRSIQLALKLIF